jgi:hypothetical protein
VDVEGTDVVDGATDVVDDETDVAVDVDDVEITVEVVEVLPPPQAATANARAATPTTDKTFIGRRIEARHRLPGPTLIAS